MCSSPAVRHSVYLFIGWAALGLLHACSVPADSRQGQPAPVMTLEQYTSIQHDMPYVLRACAGTGVLRYIGVQHSRDVQAAGVRAVIDEFNRTHPDVTFVEGPAFAPKATLEASVNAYGEAGAAIYLASQRQIRAGSLDLPFPEEAAQVVARFGEDRAIAFYGSRLLVQELRQDRHANPDRLLREKVLPWLQRNGMLADRVDPLAAFQGAVSRVFGSVSDWRQMPSEWFDPLREQGATTNEIARFLVRQRDNRFAELLATQVKSGRKIVAVAGASHVVMQEPAILSRMGCRIKNVERVRPSPSEHRCDSSCKISVVRRN